MTSVKWMSVAKFREKEDLGCCEWKLLFAVGDEEIKGGREPCVI